jgi:hypothetical protein
MAAFSGEVLVRVGRKMMKFRSLINNCYDIQVNSHKGWTIGHDISTGRQISSWITVGDKEEIIADHVKFGMKHVATNKIYKNWDRNPKYTIQIQFHFTTLYQVRISLHHNELRQETFVIHWVMTMHLVQIIFSIACVLRMIKQLI